jgi:hypothetical protein
MKINKSRTIAITLALLMIASAVGALSVSAATPTKLTQLSLQATDQSPSVTEPTTLYGRLMNGTASVQGQTITLTYSTDNGQTWNPLGTCVTNYYGGYSYTTTPTQLPLQSYQGGSQGYSAYLIQASFAGIPPYAPSSNTALIQVRPISPDVSVQTSVTQAVTYQPFTISGKMWDVHTGKACPSTDLALWVYNYNTEIELYLGSTQTDANGLYKFSQVQLTPGVWDIIVWNAYGDFNHLAGRADAFVAVNAAPTQLTIASGTANPAVNKAFTVSGVLTNAQTGARLANEQGLTLSYSSDGGSTWTTLPSSVSTNGNGQYAFSVTFPTAGVVQIQVHFPGDQNYNPSDSQVLSINVGNAIL